MSLTEQELIMKCNIYFEILGTQSNNQITIDNAAEQLNDPIADITDIESFIKKSLRDCLLQLGEIASIKGNLEIKSLQELMTKNSNIIQGLKDVQPITVEECKSDDIEQCKLKLKGYKEQLDQLVNKAKSTREVKEAEVANLQNENAAIKNLSEKLNNINVDNLEGDIEFDTENLPEDDIQMVGLIKDTLNKIKEGKTSLEASQKEIIEKEKLLKEQEDQAAQLQRQTTDYRVQTQKAMKEAEKVNDDPEDEAIEQDLQQELEAAEEKAKESEQEKPQRQLTGTEGVDVKATTKAFDETAQQVEGQGLVDTDEAMQEQLGTEKKDTPVVESDIKGVEDVGSLEDETKALEAAQTDKTPPGGEEQKTQEILDDEFKTGEKRQDGNRMGGRNKKSRKNRKSSKKKSKKNRK